MTWMTCSGTFNACRTKVPIWAVQTLVANSIDVLLWLEDIFGKQIKESYLITSIANGEMAHVASGGTEDAGERAQFGGRTSRHKGVTRVVPVLQAYKAGNAQIEVFTVVAGDKFRIVKR